MKKILRRVLFGLLGVFAILAALFTYFLYTPDPELPQLSGVLTKSSLSFDGQERTYRTYLPKNLAKGAPLVIVLHGSGQNGLQIRLETGYEFDRLADQFGFGVVYPSAGSFDWNDCSKVGDFKVDGRELDHVKLMTQLSDKLIAEHGFDPSRIFVTGVSSGGLMSLRLAIEAPTRFRAVAAVSANVPADNNFKCTVAESSTSVMVMNGTEDPIVHFDGGETSLLGLFYKGGVLHSSKESIQFFTKLNQISAAPSNVTHPSAVSSNGETQLNFEHLRWSSGTKNEVELITILGGGHGMPQAHWKRPRILGPSPMSPNGPAMIWDFFSRK